MDDTTGSDAQTAVLRAISAEKSATLDYYVAAAAMLAHSLTLDQPISRARAVLYDIERANSGHTTTTQVLQTWSARISGGS
jgi:hypothetical protein